MRRQRIRVVQALRRMDRAAAARVVLRWVGLIVALAVLALPAAVLTSSVDRHFGPHEARYSLNLSGEIVVDLGPLGAVVMPAEGHLPAGLGVHADIREIPADVGAAGSTDSIGSLSQDVAAYGTFFAQPHALIDDITRAFTTDILMRELAFVVAGLVVVLALRLLLGPPRRAELKDKARRHPLTLTTAASCAALLVAAGLIAQTWEDQERPEGNAVFAGTPLEGARVTGRLSAVVDEVGALVTEYYEENEEFYAEARANLRAAWEMEREELGFGGPGHRPQLVPPAHSYAAEDLSTFLMVADLHCNVGMPEVVREALLQSGAEYYLDAGDITMNGTEAENYCVDAAAAAVPEHIPKLFVKGNHDTEETADAARRAGFEVLEDEEIELGGVTFYGDADPRYTQFGVGSTLERDEDQAQFTERMRQEACTRDIDVLFLHDPRYGFPALSAGCAPLVLAGHWHRAVLPEVQGRGILYVSSTTGGALANALTPGPLRMDAEMTLMRFDRQTGAAVDYRIIAVHPDRSVTLGPWTPMPAPPAAPVPAPDAGELPAQEPEEAQNDTGPRGPAVI
ncbi:hypothetical protein GCM10027079_03980 [Sediminivirga luteola]